MLKKRHSCMQLSCILLSLTVFFSSFFRISTVFASSEEETQAAEGDAAEVIYRYAVTIEFGPMTFYYDHGTWNTEEMRYVSDSESSYPAANTVEGYPGWYGFDGTSNKISVKYTNENQDDKQTDLHQSIPVMIEYRALAAAEGTVVNGVYMTLYSDSSLNSMISSSFRVQHTPPETDEKTDVYVSLGGIPTVSGQRFDSESFVPIGMVTIHIGFDD